MRSSPSLRFSPFIKVRQHLPGYKLPDIVAEIRRQLSEAELGTHLKPGSTVAIGVGSRGIANIDLIVRELVGWWKEQGMQPFLFPAMGSHGAASAHGQAAVLAKYGMTESSMGCPVRSSLAVVNLGRTPEGIDVVMDRTAHSASGVMLCGRVKWHTDFAGKLESGLFKMMAIGLGKFEGAQRYHAYAHQFGLEAVIRSVGRRVLATGKILGGLAILEDGYHQTARLEAVRVEQMEQREEELLELVKSWMPRIPVKALDLLIVDELGKNWSGSGMDPKVINRTIHGALNPWPFAPVVGRVVVRDLHPLSYGNAIGLGMADVVHRRVVRKMKRQPTYVNGITSGALASLRIPVTFPTDRDCIEAIWRTTGKQDPSDLAMGWIRNTQDLTVMAFTENMRDELAADPRIEIFSDPHELEFDARGDLIDQLASQKDEAETRNESAISAVTEKKTA